MPMQQLPLGVGLRATSVFESFFPGANAALVAGLVRRAAERGEAPLWIWGGKGLGKTHLLQATCVRATQGARRAAYLPLGAAAAVTPEMLTGLESLDLVCVDDLEAVAAARDWESALFRLWNDLQERGGNLVLAAATPPAALHIAMPDLASRLRASAVYQLRPLTDLEQPDALRLKAAQRGIELPDGTLQYLVRRLPRDFAALCGVLDELDLAGLTAQRRLTVPFVRSVLEAERAATASD
jgi:DnaA family protein